MNHIAHVIPHFGGNKLCVWNCWLHWFTIMPKELLLKGLEKLEYRGYDSAGIAVVNDQGTKVFKEKVELLNYVKLQIVAKKTEQ